MRDADDDEPEAPPATPNYITPAGHKRLTTELEQLGSIERPRVVREVADAAAQGDRSENAEYIYGKKRLREIDRRMRFLIKRIDSAIVIDPTIDRGETIYFGATVIVEDDDGTRQTLQLVGEDEVDGARGRITIRSPIGAALLRKSVDDEVEVRTPRGTRTLLVIDVKYLPID